MNEKQIFVGKVRLIPNHDPVVELLNCNLKQKFYKFKNIGIFNTNLIYNFELIPNTQSFGDNVEYTARITNKP